MIRAIRHFVILGALAIAQALAAPVAQDPTYKFDLPAQPLKNSLRAIGQLTHINILFDSALVEGLSAPALRAELTTQEAIRRLTAAQNLQVQQPSPDTITVSRSDAVMSDAEGAATLRMVYAGNAQKSTSEQDSADRANAPQSALQGQLQEIVVSAQKRGDERLQDVPIPVTVVATEAIVGSNQLRLQDYYTKVPGLNLSLGFASAPVIAVRGVTTGTSNPAVGVVIDDVGYGTSISGGGLVFPPDIDPSELARIEVLRGPQGTLYGASSIGGLLKFVTVDPSTTGMSARLQGGFNSVTNGDGLGYSVRGAANVPLGSTVAVRVSGFTAQDPGYVDNVQTGQRGVNRRDSSGGRLSLLWKPSESLTVKLGALLQDSARVGGSEVDRRLGEFDQQILRGTGGYGRDAEAYSATVTGKLGRVELTSLTGYNIDEISTGTDLTPNAFFRGQANTRFGVDGVAQPYVQRTTKFSQEVRLSLPITDSLEWLIGGFYTSEECPKFAPFVAIDPATGSNAGLLLDITTRNTFEEVAGFTNLTARFTDRFDVQLGGRVSDNKHTYNAIRSGPLAVIQFGTDPSIPPGIKGGDSAFTYLVSPRYRVSAEMMVYARLASGYRPGGINANCGVAGVPCDFKADTTQNYEIGLKGSLFGRALTFDASIYDIDWTDIQLNLLTPNGLLGYTDNVGEANSRGIELSVETRPVTGMSLSGWVAFNNAELTKALPPSAAVFTRRGDRLPYSGRVSGNLSIDQEFPIAARMIGFVGGSVSYVDDRKGVFRAVAARSTFPAYTQVDLHAGLKLDTWTFNAFATNLTDERGVLRGQFDSTDPNFITYIQPRTIGLSVAKIF